MFGAEQAAIVFGVAIAEQTLQFSVTEGCMHTAKGLIHSLSLPLREHY